MVTFGGESSIVDVQLFDDGQQTLLKLTHSVLIELAGSGAADAISAAQQVSLAQFVPDLVRPE